MGKALIKIAALGLLGSFAFSLSADAQYMCNAVAIGDGLNYVGCSGGSPIGPVECQGEMSSDCDSGGTFACDLSGYGVASLPYYYCSNLPPIGGIQVAGGNPDRMPTEADAAAAKKKAREEEMRRLEAEAKERERRLAEMLAAKGSSTLGDNTSAQKSADLISFTGMNEAALIGATWCANGANIQGEDKELAEKSYGNCKQYLGVADELRAQRGGKDTLTADPKSLVDGWAGGVMGEFEKKFGVAKEEYMSRLLGSRDRGAELSSMTEGKIKSEELAEAFANGKADENKFEVKIGGKEVKKETSLRAAIKKSLADEGNRVPAAENITAEEKTAKAEPKIRGLTPLEDQFAGLNPSTVELTLFQVVHRKYREIEPRL